VRLVNAAAGAKAAKKVMVERRIGLEARFQE
jgi:hypothetical protein